MTPALLIAQYRSTVDASVFSSLDGQAHGRRVHDSAGDLLDTIGEIGLELFLVESYARQALISAQVSFPSAHGLAFCSRDRGLMDGKTGRLQQCDGTFMRESEIARG